MTSPALPTPKNALDTKRSQLRALLRVYRQSPAHERSLRVRVYFRKMVKSAQN